MLSEYVLLGNEGYKGLSLAACTERRGIAGKDDRVSQQIKLGVDTYNIPNNWLEEYCHVDVDITKELFLNQREELAERGQLHLAYQRGLVAACLADIEPNGLRLDTKRVYEEYEKIHAEYIDTEQKLQSFDKINWNSRKQVATFLYDKLRFAIPRDSRGKDILTSRGARPTDKEAFLRLVAKTKEQKEFVELYKKLANLNAKLTKSLQFFKGVCDDHNEVFMGIFNQGRTTTHRLSSSGRPILLPSQTKQGKPAPRGVQFQNLPRDYKRLFKAKRDGWEIFEVDGAGLEFVVAADLGHDTVAMHEIEIGEDIHSITAKTLTNAGEPTTRQEAKSRTFTPLFAGMGKTKAEKVYAEFFKKKYSGISNTQQSWLQEVVKSQELVTPYGMIFRWPGTKVSRTGYVDNTTSISNYPIQGLATAEIIPLALLCFWHKTRNLRAEIVNTIHDSIVAEVHPDDVEQVEEIAKVCFTTDVYRLLDELYEYNFTASLGVGMKHGPYWGDGKETKLRVKNNQQG